MKMYKNKLIIGALLGVIGLSLSFTACSANKKEKELHITVDGKEYTGVDINTNGITKIETDYGYNKILIEDGNIRVIEADCPDKTCVKKGFINKNMDNTDMIICAPHRLSISFY